MNFDINSIPEQYQNKYYAQGNWRTIWSYWKVIVCMLHTEVIKMLISKSEYVIKKFENNNNWQVLE